MQVNHYLRLIALIAKKPEQDYTGPALAGCRSREPHKEWAYAFVDNVNAMLYRATYAKRLFEK